MNLPISADVKFWLNFFHPLLMWVLLGVSIYALYLGVQWRRARTAEGEQKKDEKTKNDKGPVEGQYEEVKK